MSFRREIGQLWQFYDAFNRRDIEAALALLHPDVDWPNGSKGGRLRGHEAFRSYWLEQWAERIPSVTPLDCCESTDGLRVAVHRVVRDLNGALLHDGHVHHVYRFEDELVHRMDIHP